MIDFTEFERKNYEDIKRFRKSLRFKVLEIRKILNSSPWRTAERIEKMLAMKDKFSHVEDLKFAMCIISPEDFEKLARIFVPKLQTCHLWSFSYSKPSRFGNYIECDSLKALSLDGNDPLLWNSFFGGINLKSLALTSRARLDLSSLDFNETSIWNLANFKLTKLEVFGCLEAVEESFLLFLRAQTDLEEVSFVHNERAGDEYLDVLLQLPSHRCIKMVTKCNFKVDTGHSIPWCCETKIWSCRVVEMSSVPHQHLSKFQIWTERDDDEFETNLFFWKYAPDPPRNTAMFERNVLEFLNSDCDIPGKKNSSVIKSITIGNGLWFRSPGVFLSKTFIRSLIALLPKLTRIEIFSSSARNEINDIIEESGRTFKEIRIHARNGE